jgi:hypothetical protein
MAAYKENFPVGSTVRILDSDALDQFARTWKLHHQLEPEQMPFAGKRAVVAKVGFYHGGDVLYTLHSVPGIWHEQCLQNSDGA